MHDTSICCDCSELNYNLINFTTMCICPSALITPGVKKDLEVPDPAGVTGGSAVPGVGALVEPRHPSFQSSKLRMAGAGGDARAPGGPLGPPGIAPVLRPPAARDQRTLEGIKLKDTPILISSTQSKPFFECINQ